MLGRLSTVSIVWYQFIFLLPFSTTGYNNDGELGYGDTTGPYRGSHTGTMGDALDVVDIGSGFGDSVRITAHGGTYSNHFCIYEETNELPVKCWGSNSKGQLGYGDTTDRGTSASQMGDGLPFVDHKFIYVAPPTTAVPTSEPTVEPSVSPTEPQCDVDEMYDVNWHNLVRPYSVHSLSLSLCTFCQSPRERTFSPRILSPFDTVSTLPPLLLSS